MKDDLAAPEKLVYIKHLKELQGIRRGAGDCASVPPRCSWTSSRVRSCRKQTPLLAMAAGKIGTPQVRNMATSAATCASARGAGIFATITLLQARRQHVLLGRWRERLQRDPRRRAVVHRAPVGHRAGARRARRDRRLTGGAQDRTVPIDRFFVSPKQDPSRENVLLTNEILAEIEVPNAPAGSKAIYIKEMVREVWDFALCSVAAMVTVQNGVVADARIVLGGVAPVPYRALKAEAAIKGKPIDDASAAAAGVAATDGARPSVEKRLQGRADTGGRQARAALARMTTNEWPAAPLDEWCDAFNEYRGAHPDQSVALFEADLAGSGSGGRQPRGRRSPAVADGGMQSRRRAVRGMVPEWTMRTSGRPDSRAPGSNGSPLKSGVFQGADLRGAALHGASLRRWSSATRISRRGIHRRRPRGSGPPLGDLRTR